MELTLFSKYQHLDTLTTVAVDRLRPCYEIAKLFVVELNKTAGQPYITKGGKHGVSVFYNEVLVMKDLKKLKISGDVHKAHGFFEECLKSKLGFRFYYKCVLKSKK